MRSRWALVVTSGLLEAAAEEGGKCGDRQKHETAGIQRAQRHGVLGKSKCFARVSAENQRCGGGENHLSRAGIEVKGAAHCVKTDIIVACHHRKHKAGPRQRHCILVAGNDCAAGERDGRLGVVRPGWRPSARHRLLEAPCGVGEGGSRRCSIRPVWESAMADRGHRQTKLLRPKQTSA